MRSGWLGLAGALVFATTLVAGCSSDSSSDSSSDTANSGGSAGGAGAVRASDCTMSAGGTEVTSLCGAAPLNTLTEAEAIQLCNDTGDYVASSITRATGCHYLGIISAASSSSPTEAQLQSACSAKEASCSTDATVIGPGGNILCGQVPPTCTATVAQYSSCVRTAC